MFIDINGMTYNVNAISSFTRVDKKVQRADYTFMDKYVITYNILGGITEDEYFDTQEERDEKYNILRSRLLMEDFRDEEESNEEDNSEEVSENEEE